MTEVTKETLSRNKRLTPRAERDELLDLDAGVASSFSSFVSAADTDEKDSPLAALATLVRNPSRTKEGLDDDSFLSSKTKSQNNGVRGRILTGKQVNNATRDHHNIKTTLIEQAGGGVRDMHRIDVRIPTGC